MTGTTPRRISAICLKMLRRFRPQTRALRARRGGQRRDSSRGAVARRRFRRGRNRSCRDDGYAGFAASRWPQTRAACRRHCACAAGAGPGGAASRSFATPASGHRSSRGRGKCSHRRMDATSARRLWPSEQRQAIDAERAELEQRRQQLFSRNSEFSRQHEGAAKHHDEIQNMLRRRESELETRESVLASRLAKWRPASLTRARRSWPARRGWRRGKQAWRSASRK